jgi:hypothetical protein
MSVKNEYYRQWREKNKERIKAYNKKYWERKQEESDNKKNENEKVEDKDA